MFDFTYTPDPFTGIGDINLKTGQVTFSTETVICDSFDDPACAIDSRRLGGRDETGLENNQRRLGSGPTRIICESQGSEVPGQELM